MINNLIPTLIPAIFSDLPTLQHMGKFYEYEMSRVCGWSWEGEDGGYPSPHLIANFRRYFEEENRYPYLIKVGEELAGFVLINKAGMSSKTEWNMGEFFVLAKFQGKGIGQQTASQIWGKFPGFWEVSVLPKNKNALSFWRKVISHYTGGQYIEEIKHVDYDKSQSTRCILLFNV